MNNKLADDFISSFARWASTQPDIRAVGLVGSHARNAANESSDIDLVIITDHPNKYLKQTEWTRSFGTVVRQQVEDYGMVTSLRTWYADGLEIEYGITFPVWAQTPLDAGTRQVIEDGMRVLFERDALLSPLRKGEG